ncbi:hypothetical protein ACFO3I_09500 [Rheinheimera marina]|uniref:Transglycosylase SLT domain-containing protein n=1 Tax=Rheinheimera marina TaxID=1774958 RepID=A0ABV9JM41_9GAMM
MKKIKKSLVTFTCVALLSGCAVSPPQNKENLCEIFREHDDWYDAAADARDRWQVPVHVPMAIMYQESSFRQDAQPPMQYWFGFIPVGRASSAYGYAQVKDETWDDYARETGGYFVSRSNFADAIDFMGWYIHKTSRVNGVSKSDAYAQYLNYHEGWGGYKRGSYRQKAWLMQTSRLVQQRSSRYQQQLLSCEEEFKRGWFWGLFD